MRLALLFLLSLLYQSGFSQKSKSHFSLEFNFTPNLSLTNLDRRAVPASGYGSYLLSIENPKRPFRGHSYGMGFYFPVAKKVELGIEIGYEYKGQSSSKIPSSRNENVSFSHSFILESYQLSLNSRYYLDQKISIFDQFISIHLLSDVYSKFTALQYYYPERGFRQKGSSEEIYYNPDGLTNLKSHVSEKLIRFSFGVGYGLRFNQVKFLTAKLALELKYYSGLISDDVVFAIPGNAVLLNLKFIAGFKP